MYSKTFIYLFYVLHIIDDFAEISKNLSRYRSENNFVELLK